MKPLIGITATVAVIAAIAVAAAGEQAASQTPHTALSIVNKMVTAYRSVRTINDNVTIVRTVGDKQVTSTMQVAAERPGKFLLDLKGDKINTLLVNDGVQTTAFRSDRKIYLKARSAPLLMKSDPLSGIDVPTPGAELLASLISNTIRESVTPAAKLLMNADFIGNGKVGESSAYILGFTGPEGLTGKIYVSENDFLIRRLTLSQGDKIVLEEKHDVTVNQSLPSSTFLAVLPTNATLVFAMPKLDAIQFSSSSGVMAADFNAEADGGGNLHLSDYRGKVVVLDFWATWCVPCQKSMPHIEKVYRGTQSQDVVVLGLCVWDDKDSYDQWLPEHKSQYTFKFAFDTNGKNGRDIAKTLYGVSGIPTTVIIDKEGHIVDKIVGFIEGDTRVEVALRKVGVRVN